MRWRRHRRHEPISLKTRSPIRIRRAAALRTSIRIDTAPRGNSSSKTRPSAAPSGVFRTRTLVVPGVGEGAPGRRSRARNRTGTVVSSTSETRTGSRRARVRHAAGRRAPTAEARPSASAARRRAPRDSRRARRQPGDLRRRRVGVDGGTRPDGGGQRRDAVAAARCLSASRQGRRHHVPSAGCDRCCCRRRRRCTSPGAGWHGSTPAAKRRWRRGCWPRATSWCGRRRATVRGAAWWWCSPTVAPPVGPIRWAARVPRQPGCVAEGAAAVVVDCETSYRATGFGRGAGPPSRRARGAAGAAARRRPDRLVVRSGA